MKEACAVIPAVVNQVYVDPDGRDGPAPQEVRAMTAAWARHQPSHRQIIWGPPDVHRLCVENGFGRVADAIGICRLPAMQADLMRLVVIFLTGGWWADLRVVPLRPCLNHLELAPVVLAEDHPTDWRSKITNRFLGAEPKAELVARVLDSAVKNVEERRQGSLIDLTGSNLLTRALDGGLAEGEGSVTVLPAHIWGDVLDLVAAPYNRQGQHWAAREVREGLYLPSQMHRKGSGEGMH